jgi:hypothetical protein
MGTVSGGGGGWMVTVSVDDVARQHDTDTSENDHSLDGRMVRGVSAGGRVSSDDEGLIQEGHMVGLAVLE